MEIEEKKCEAEKLAEACNNWGASVEMTEEILKKLAKNGMQASMAGNKLSKEFVKIHKMNSK